MKPSGPKIPRKRWRRVWILLLVAALGAAAARELFPGARLGIALKLATGFRLQPLQARIDALQEKAIRRQTFNAVDKQFLMDFYGSLATGAKLTIVVRQTGRLMDRYLDRSGVPYRLEPSIFTDNQKVSVQLAALHARLLSAHCNAQQPLLSPTFYMPDSSKIDSVFGLYFGTLRVTATRSSAGRCRAHFRAEVPWTWPSYESIRSKYGRYHAESFPLPNLASLFFGREHALYVDNGLGEYLVHLGLAAPFTAYAEWDEDVN